MASDVLNIAIIGSGSVATHLSKGLSAAGHTIVQVFSRQQKSAQLLAFEYGAEPFTDIENINPDLDLYLVAISDDAVALIMDRMPKVRGVVAHTSGSLPLSILEKMESEYGVFYPLQTFSKGVPTLLETVPFCIEGDSEETSQILIKLAQQLSRDVRMVDSHQRSVLHIAAVFSCNFTNYLYSIAHELLQDNGLDISILLPLIKATAAKLESGKSPKQLQTGPASRGDLQIMAKHHNALTDKPDFQMLYKILSELIEQSSDA